ncbi:MAG: YcjX family protein [Pseudomonadota bacterium]
MRIGNLADSLLSGLDQAAEAAGRWFEPTVRLGVTGLSGAGKTVFITALVASLLRRGRMRDLAPETEGRILGAMLSPQPDPTIPRFPYEAHLAALTAPNPRWPSSTRSVSQLRVSFRYRPRAYMALSGAGRLHLDIVDFPGEWLADLALLDRDYESWAAEALATAERPGRHAQAETWRSALAAVDPSAPHEELVAEALAAAYAGYLAACRKEGMAALAPGRFLMPGDLAGSPALTFAPLPKPEAPGRDSLYAELRRRYDAYRKAVVQPFFQDHFAALDRQVVLVDVLGALAAGPRALGDLAEGMESTLAAFRHGASSWLDRLLGNHRIDRLLFLASKADHLHHEQHAALTHMAEALLAEAADRAAFHGAETRAMAVAAVRATAEQTVTRDGARLALVRGRHLETGRDVAVHPGALPDDPRALLATARDPEGAGTWPDADFARVPFAPPAWGPRAEDGPPHIRLDRALNFLIGDKLD